MIDALKANVRAAMTDYESAVYGCSALGYITIICTTDALDMLEERLPGIIKQEMKQKRNLLRHGDDERGELSRLAANISEHYSGKKGNAWASDFGRAAYDYVRMDVEKLRLVTANYINSQKVKVDGNVAAALIVAQSMASEAANFCERRAERLKTYAVTNDTLVRMSASDALLMLNTRRIERTLRRMLALMLDNVLPDGFDLFNDRSTETGVKVVLNRIDSIEMWTYARDKANELNSERNKLKITKEQ